MVEVLGWKKIDKKKLVSVILVLIIGAIMTWVLVEKFYPSLGKQINQMINISNKT